MNKPTQFITVHKVRKDDGCILDIKANKQTMQVLTQNAYVLYMRFMLTDHGLTKKLTPNKIIETTSLTEQTYLRAFNELIQKKYLVKNYSKEDKDYYGFYEDPDMPSRQFGFGENHPLTVDEYISKYLTPNAEIPADMTFDKIAAEVIDAPVDYEPFIDEAVQALSYSDFLATLYWKTIAYVKRKQMRYKCEICNGSKNLNVHHRTYAIHGIEHYSSIIDKDLMLVCEKCHGEIHNITEDEI